MVLPNVRTMLTYKQVAEHLQLSERTVATLVKMQQLRCVRLSGSVRVDPVDLNDFIERSKSSN